MQDLGPTKKCYNMFSFIKEEPPNFSRKGITTNTLTSLLPTNLDMLGSLELHVEGPELHLATSFRQPAKSDRSSTSYSCIVFTVFSVKGKTKLKTRMETKN